LVAFAVKTPPGTLVLLAAAICLALPFRLGGAREETIAKSVFLLIPIIALIIITAVWGINIGLRHFLPVYPFLFMFIGALASLRPLSKMARNLLFAAILLGVGWNVYEAIKISPYNLAYFNPFVGGPEHGPNYLSDSNIDWGQSTKALKDYMDRMGVPVIYYAFAGGADPWYYGVKYQYVAGYYKTYHGILVPRNAPRELLAINVMVAQGVSVGGADAYHWLRERKPIDRVGYSILIYDITGDDMAHAYIAYGCYGYALYDLAAHEARRALEINPSNEPAKQLLASIARIQAPQVAK
jgi:hypothetical protein